MIVLNFIVKLYIINRTHVFVYFTAIITSFIRHKLIMEAY